MSTKNTSKNKPLLIGLGAVAAVAVTGLAVLMSQGDLFQGSLSSLVENKSIDYSAEVKKQGLNFDLELARINLEEQRYSVKVDNRLGSVVAMGDKSLTVSLSDYKDTNLSKNLYLKLEPVEYSVEKKTLDEEPKNEVKSSNMDNSPAATKQSQADESAVNVKQTTQNNTVTTVKPNTANVTQPKTVAPKVTTPKVTVPKVTPPKVVIPKNTGSFKINFIPTVSAQSAELASQTINNADCSIDKNLIVRCLNVLDLAEGDYAVSVKNIAPAFELDFTLHLIDSYAPKASVESKKFDDATENKNVERENVSHGTAESAGSANYVKQEESNQPKLSNTNVNANQIVKSSGATMTNLVQPLPKAPALPTQNIPVKIGK